MNNNKLLSYARLIVTCGANVRPGQEVMVIAELDQPEFVSLLVEQCYIAGASKVTVEWNYQPLTVTHVKYRTPEVLGRVEMWERAKLKHRCEVLPAVIYLDSEDPDGLDAIDQKKNADGISARYKIIKKYRDKMENRYQWCIAAVPGIKWARKVFPNTEDSDATERLWEAILRASRADSDPLARWEEHNRNLHDRCAYLNSLGIRSLHYLASNGTDLKVGLIENSMFLGGRENTLSGIPFNANIPSEEIFISPKKGEAEGIVYSSRPFSYRGQMIEDFSIKFENGRATEVHARKNEELLKTMIAMDKGASYLGECALIPYNSPIQNMSITFYSTLFDENASCHLALGEGFSNCIRDYDKYTLADCRRMGINQSVIHEDFMIGTSDLNIIATLSDGSQKQIFANGNWAF